MIAATITIIIARSDWKRWSDRDRDGDHDPDRVAGDADQGVPACRSCSRSRASARTFDQLDLLVRVPIDGRSGR